MSWNSGHQTFPTDVQWMETLTDEEGKWECCEVSFYYHGNGNHDDISRPIFTSRVHKEIRLPLTTGNWSRYKHGRPLLVDKVNILMAVLMWKWNFIHYTRWAQLQRKNPFIGTSVNTCTLLLLHIMDSCCSLGKNNSECLSLNRNADTQQKYCTCTRLSKTRGYTTFIMN